MKKCHKIIQIDLLEDTVYFQEALEDGYNKIRFNSSPDKLFQLIEIISTHKISVIEITES